MQSTEEYTPRPDEQDDGDAHLQPDNEGRGSVMFQRSKEMCAKALRPQRQREVNALEELLRRVEAGERIEWGGRWAWMNDLTPEELRATLAQYIPVKREETKPPPRSPELWDYMREAELARARARQLAVRGGVGRSGRRRRF
jgi:hypothetical protein